MSKNAISLLALALAIFMPIQAGAAAQTLAPWQTLANLEGSWRLAAPRTGAQRGFRISFRMISKGSALVETFGDPSKNVTQTIYHRDGNNIMATHYCAQGNQPRLVLGPSTSPAALSFGFLDITNLANKDASHLVKIDFKIIDGNRVERRETYTEMGVTEESVLQLERER